MSLYKRDNSKYWWLDFEFEGRRHRLSTKCKNKRAAESFEAAYRTQLANDKVGLKPRRPAAPTLSEAVNDFMKWSSVHITSRALPAVTKHRAKRYCGSLGK